MWNPAAPFLPCFYYGSPMPWYPLLQPPSFHPPETAAVNGKACVTASLLGCPPSSNDSQPLMEETTAKPRVQEKKRQLKKEKLLKKRVELVLLQEREDNFEKKKQKKDRNLPSNIFRNFAALLHTHPQPSALLPTSSNSPPPPSCASLLPKLKQLMRPNLTYIRPSLIQSLWRGCDLTADQAVLFRILMKRFLQVELPIMVGSMGKLKKMQKTAYLRLARKLYEQLRRQYFQ